MLPARGSAGSTRTVPAALSCAGENGMEDETGPGWVAPMLATAGPVPSGDRWAYEIKFDGIHATAATRPAGCAAALTQPEGPHRRLPGAGRRRPGAGDAARHRDRRSRRFRPRTTSSYSSTACTSPARAPSRWRGCRSRWSCSTLLHHAGEDLTRTP